MEPEGSLSCSQQIATERSNEPLGSIQDGKFLD
jgi:hypothetical protein